MYHIEFAARIKSFILSVNTAWYSVRSSYWFLPTLMMFGAVVLSFVMIYIDYSVINVDEMPYLKWLSVNKPEGARSLLSTVAGSMITITGVVFSITIVALTLASSQYGPRLLENFMKDRGNQIVLGTFIATFVYCLLILISITRGEGSIFISHLSVMVGIVLAILSIVVLIYFIDHAATSIQATNVINVASKNLDNVIEELFPERIGLGKKLSSSWWIAPEENPEELDKKRVPIYSDMTGYIRVIDIAALMNLSRKNNLIVDIGYKPGDFIVERSPIVHFRTDDAVAVKLMEDTKAAFVIGTKRTIEQDAEYAIDQLVEVAVRALSAGINDPFTAILCVDRLASALCEVAERMIPSPNKYDEQNQLRVITKPTSFSDLLDSSFNQIRQYGQKSAAITIRLLESLALIAERVTREEDKEALLRHAGMIKRGCVQGLSEEMDRKEVEVRYEKVLEALG